MNSIVKWVIIFIILMPGSFPLLAILGGGIFHCFITEHKSTTPVSNSQYSEIYLKNHFPSKVLNRELKGEVPFLEIQEKRPVLFSVFGNQLATYWRVQLKRLKNKLPIRKFKS